MKKNNWIFILWLFVGLLFMIGMYLIYETQIPIFTIIWLLSVLIILLKGKKASEVGFNKVPLKKLLIVTALNLLATLSVIFIIEITTHTYENFVQIAVENKTPDPTFIWLEKYEGFMGYFIMFIVTCIVTIFGEELFFRGLLLQTFKRKWNGKVAIILQAILFTLPQIIIAFFLTPLEAIMLVFGYGILIYGVIGGIAASKTDSIWPSLITASINNLILVLIYL